MKIPFLILGTFFAALAQGSRSTNIHGHFCTGTTATLLANVSIQNLSTIDQTIQVQGGLRSLTSTNKDVVASWAPRNCGHDCTDQGGSWYKIAAGGVQEFLALVASQPVGDYIAYGSILVKEDRGTVTAFGWTNWQDDLNRYLPLTINSGRPF